MLEKILKEYEYVILACIFDIRLKLHEMGLGVAGWNSSNFQKF